MFLASTLHKEIIICCLSNFASIIKSHNNRILSEGTIQGNPKQGYRRKATCPLERSCLDKIHENITNNRVSHNGIKIACLKTDLKNVAILSSVKIFWEMKRKDITYQTIYQRTQIVQLMLDWEVPHFYFTAQRY